MNKTALKYISIIFLGLATFWGCEPCIDCGPENSYPYFNLSILNETSLDTLKQYKDSLTKQIKSVETALENPQNAPVADSLNNLLDIKTDSLNLINALVKTTNTRSISIESINGETRLFENRNGGDSLTRFKIPINTNQEVSEYAFKIEFSDSIRHLKLSYELVDTAINNKITKAAKNLRVIEHGFDSLSGLFGCKPVAECISNELEIYVEI